MQAEDQEGGRGEAPVLERYVSRSGNAIQIHSLNSFRHSGVGFSSVTRSIVQAGEKKNTREEGVRGLLVPRPWKRLQVGGFREKASRSRRFLKLPSLDSWCESVNFGF